jgi:type IV secretory pathway VirD2 relaxase
MPDDDFELWLGRIAQDRPLRHRMRGAVNRAGGARGGRGSEFTGARIGRGAGVGAMLASPGYRSGASGRRVVVKASIVKLAGKGLASATAHMRYLQRDGTTREGDRGQLYGAGDEPADGKAFVERGSGDRHQFRFIVSPEDGAEYDDLKSLTRRWMERVEQDLGTKLDWVAVDHFNTGHPHSHVIVRGKDHLGKDLIIARNYLTHGLRGRAAELVDLDLGPRSPQEMLRAATREIEQERFTGIDRRLIGAVGEDGTLRPVSPDSIEQSLRAGRLQTLGRMGLAVEAPRGVWRLDDDLEQTLRRMGERNDIIRTMQKQMTEHAPERPPGDHVIYDAAKGTGPITGKVIARGLSDEHADRHYLIVDGTDGLSHYVDIGVDAAETRAGSIVRVTPTPIAVRQVDRTVAEVAQMNGGRYTVDLHLKHDPNATETFAETHVRRLEALRRASGVAEREADGTWIIAPDHLDRVEAYERQRAERTPIVLETLTMLPIERQAQHDGPTWLDREMIADKPAELGRGFGAEVRKAMMQRQQWLIEQDLAEQHGDTIRIRPNVLQVLQQRELSGVADQLSRELGLTFNQARAGQAVDGVFRRSVVVGDSKFALIEKSREFTLVPWRPVLERAVGKQVSGIMRESGVSWTIGRGRSGPQIGGF